MKIRLILFFYILLLTVRTFAQPAMVPGGLKTLVEESFKKYPRIESMNQLVELSQTQVDLSRAGYLPVANGDLSYHRLYPTPIIDLPFTHPIPFQIFPADNFNASVDVSQPILDFNTGAKVGKAKGNLLVASDNLESMRSQLAYQIAQVYYGIIFLNKSIKVQKEQLDLLSSSLKQIQSKIQNGDALKYDLLSTQVQYTNADNLYSDLQNQLQKQYNTLDMLSGRTSGNYINDTLIDPAAFTVIADSVLAISMKNNPDLQTANDKVEAAKWDIKMANRSRLPVMNFQGEVGYKNGFIPNLGSFMFNYYLGVGMTIPLLPANRPSLQKKLAEIGLNTSQLDLNTQQLTLTNQVQNSLLDMQVNQKKFLTSDNLVHQARTALELAIVRYKDGVNTSLDLLSAQTNYQNALLNQLQFEYNLLLSKIELSRLTGNKWW